MTQTRQSSATRIAALDVLRGIAVVLMVVHHFLYDLVEFCGAPAYLFSNPVFDVLHYLFAGLLILLSGVASRFSRSNLRRGIKLAGIALALTGVTMLLSMPIVFGVLHLLACCMIFYGLAGPVLERLRGFAAPVWYAALGGASLFLREWLNPVSIGFLFPLGLVAPGFFSADYFPLFPWLFVFLMGTYLGGPIKAGRFPAFFYKISPGFFGAVGRHALIVYLLHQPVLFCLAKCLAYFIPFS